MIPWTNSSVYVGLVPIVFAALALVYRRTRFVCFFGIVTLILVLVSFGNNFSLLYQTLFSVPPVFQQVPRTRNRSCICSRLPPGFSPRRVLRLLAARERNPASTCATFRGFLISGGVIARPPRSDSPVPEQPSGESSRSMFTRQDQAHRFSNSTAPGHRE